MKSLRLNHRRRDRSREKPDIHSMTQFPRNVSSMPLGPIRAVMFIVGAWYAVNMTWSEEQAASPQEDDQRPALHGILDQAISLGFPDIRGSSLYEGELTIQWNSASGPQKATCDGVHAKLSTGAWLVCCYEVIQADHGVTIDASQTKLIDPSQLGDLDDAWRVGDIFDMDQRHLYRPDSDMAGPICAMALALGNAHPEQCLMIAGSDLQSQPPPWTAIPLTIFDPEDDPRYWYESTKTGIEEVTRPQHTRYSAPEAFRVSMACWFLQQLIGVPQPFEPVPPERAASAAQSLCPVLGTAYAGHVTCMVERTHLLQHAPVEHDDMPTRLRSWRVSGALQEDETRIYINELLAHDSSAIKLSEAQAAWQTGLRDELEKWHRTRFSLNDLPELIALCSSFQTSEWLDKGRPRAVGDQAVRAIASILEIDPRLIAGRDVMSPWTDQERQEVAKGLSAWWKRNATRSREDMQCALLPDLPVAGIGHLLCMTPPEQRRGIIDTLMRMWRAGPPDGPIEAVLPYALSDPAFSACVESWPIASPHRALLAAWHLYHHDPAPCRVLLDQAIAMRGDDPDLAPALDDALAVNALKPDVQTLIRLQGLLSAAPLSAAAEQLVVSIASDGFGPLAFLWGRMAIRMYGPPADDSDSSITLKMTLLAQLLKDHRPASPGLMALARTMVEKSGRHINEFPLALRICDVASSNAWNLMNGMHQTAGEAEESLGRFPFGASLAERDEFINAIIRRIQRVLPARLTRFELPLTIPGFNFPSTTGDSNDF